MLISLPLVATCGKLLNRASVGAELRLYVSQFVVNYLRFRRWQITLASIAIGDKLNRDFHHKSSSVI